MIIPANWNTENKVGKTMKYVCQICGYIYADTKEKVPFEQLLADWKCPLCGAAKIDFKPETADGKKKSRLQYP